MSISSHTSHTDILPYLSNILITLSSNPDPKPNLDSKSNFNFKSNSNPDLKI